MRIRRTILRLGLIVAVAAVLAAAAMFLLASRIPAGYAPPHLDAPEQVLQAKRLVNHVTGGFGNPAGAGQPFTWSITADQANAYLASIDAIASLPETTIVRRPTVRMEKAGISAPAVAMRDGVLTVMAEWTRHNKIVSVDLAFAFDGEGNIRLRVLAGRIGVLPAPRAVMDGLLARARGALAAQLATTRPRRAGGQGSDGDAPVRGVAELLGNLVNMLDGRSVPPELVWKLNATHRVLIDRVRITDGRVEVHCVPVTP